MQVSLDRFKPTQQESIRYGLPNFPTTIIYKAIKSAHIDMSRYQFSKRIWNLESFVKTYNEYKKNPKTVAGQIFCCIFNLALLVTSVVVPLLFPLTNPMLISAGLLFLISLGLTIRSGIKLEERIYFTNVKRLNKEFQEFTRFILERSQIIINHVDRVQCRGDKILTKANLRFLAIRYAKPE